LLGVAGALADGADLERPGAVIEDDAIAGRVVVGLAGCEGAGDQYCKQFLLGCPCWPGGQVQKAMCERSHRIWQVKRKSPRLFLR